MDLKAIKKRLAESRKALSQALLSGQRVDANHPLIDPGLRQPDRMDSLDLWCVQMAGIVANQSAHFHHDSTGRADVGETALFASQLKYYLAEFFGDYYPMTDCRGFLTVDGSLPVGATEYSSRRLTKHGRMKAVSAYAKDRPRITIAAEEDTNKNVEYQGEVLYTLAELEHAAYAGLALSTEELMALAMAAEQNFEQVWHSGDTDYGLWGYYLGAAVTSIPLYAAVTGTWNAATHDQIIGDVRALMYGIRNATNVSMLYPDSLVVPSSLMQYLGVRRTNTDITVRNALMEEYPGIKIYESHLADTLDAAGTGPRLLAFQSGKHASRFGEPRKLDMLAPQQEGAAIVTIGRQNLAGAFLPQPLAFGHMDGC